MTARLSPGTVIAGRFAVTGLLGEGPMGEVYDVRDAGSGATFACKLLSPAAAQTPAWAAFQEEARRGSAIDGLARVLEVGFDPGVGAPFVMMERVSMPSLERAVRDAAPLVPAAVATMLRGLAAPLAMLHATGLTHRNVRPPNVFVGAGGQPVRLTDIGIAALRAAAPPPSGPIAYGWVPAEVAQGGASTPAADTWAMGALAFFAMTGRSPFVALSVATLDAGHLWTEMTTPLPPASHRAAELGATIPQQLDAWFARALAVSPAERFQTPGEAAEAFAAAVASLPAAKPLTAKGTMMMGASDATAALDAAQALWAETQIAMPAVQPGQPGGARPAAGAPAPAPMPAAGAPMQPQYAPPPAGPPPGAGFAAQAMPGPAVSLPPPPPKKSALPIVLGLVAVLVVVGGAIGGFLFLRGGGDSGSKASTEPAPTPAASQAEPAASAPAAPPPASAEAPAASASATPPPASATDAQVTFACTPECDEIKCDGKKIDGASVRLAPGKHVCVATKKDHVPSTDRFTTKAGEDLSRPITMTKLPEPAVGAAAPAKKKCTGTFLQNCK